jgi:predicted acylesterase/phospholipase RssA
MTSSDKCCILSLDGGGAKGFYTLGVLTELEAFLGAPLSKHFDLIFGTSTGSIIAALLSLGCEVEEIRQSYREHVPKIMRAKSPAEKSARLSEVGEAVLGDKTFHDVQTGLGIVSVKWRTEMPMIFKSNKSQLHGRLASFEPGFGVKLREAVEASCSAYPFFEKKSLTTASGDNFVLIDGGFCANNPALYALVDATGPLGFGRNDCRLISIGVGHYPEPKLGWSIGGIKTRLIRKMLLVQLLQKTLDVNTESMDVLRKLLFKDVPSVRISESYTTPDMATDMFEHDLEKLNLLRQRGRESYGLYEKEIENLFK